jgi:tryptophanyl-tRNA synthetase
LQHQKSLIVKRWFNHQMDFHFRSKVREDNMHTWTNGGKMSKSANNINIFLEDKALRKQVMSIETDRHTAGR